MFWFVFNGRAISFKIDHIFESKIIKICLCKVKKFNFMNVIGIKMMKKVRKPKTKLILK